MKFTLAAFVLLLATQACAAKQQVTLYSEALCPECREVFKNHIMPLWEKGTFEHVQFSMVPSGNAVLNEQGELSCQHGAAECYLNRFLSCAIGNADSVDQWIPYVGCVEEHADEVDQSTMFVEICATQANLDFSELYKCATGEEGRMLSLEAYHATQKVHPRWVPWIIVNGRHVSETFLEEAICLGIKKMKNRPMICKNYGGSAAQQ